MSVHDTLFAVGAAKLLAAHHSDSAAVTFITDSDDYDVDAIVGEETKREQPIRGGTQVIRIRNVLVQSADVPDDLKVNDAAEVDGTTGYSVSVIGSTEGGLVEIELIRHGLRSMQSDNFGFGA